MPGPDDELELAAHEEIPENEVESEVAADEDPAGELEQAPDDGDEDAQGAQPGEVAAKPGRAEGRIQRLAREAKEAREEVANERKARQELENRLARLEKPAVQEKEPTADEMALWTPDQIIDYKLGKATSRFEATIGQMQFQNYESGDKANFNALCAQDPIAAKYKDEVETRLADMRSKGQNVDRERLLTYIIGEKVRQNGSKAKAKQAQDGQRRIKRETVQSGSGKGDTAAPRRGEKSLEERLANVTF
jgi:hypothetical protein